MSARRFAAIDLGASGGRVMTGRWDGARFALEERHRFGNGPVVVAGRWHWDALRLWSEIVSGLAVIGADGGGAPASIGIDTWGVDFALLDREGRLLGNPYHYRDRRTDGLPGEVEAIVPADELWATTGVGTLQINTLFQLFAMARTGDPALEAASRLVPIPNLFATWLGGEPVAEYTHASTSQCLDARRRDWAESLLGRLGIPTAILPPLVTPGTAIGRIRDDVAAEAGWGGGGADRPSIVAIGSHDTASAVAAIPGLGPDSVYISSGTWSLMGVETPEPVLSEAARRHGFSNEGGIGGSIRLLKVIPGLWLVQECRRQWAREGRDRSWEELLALAEAAPAFGPLVDPGADAFLTPPDMPAAIRDFCRSTGQRPPETEGEIVRTCLESLAVRYRATLDELEAVVGRRLATVHVVGGGSMNRTLCRMTADACDRPVLAGPVEATALGNVMVQAVATGDLDGFAAGREAIAASVAVERYEPAASRDGWDEALARLRSVEVRASA